MEPIQVTFEVAQIVAGYDGLPVDMRPALEHLADSEIDATIAGTERLAISLETYGFAAAADRWMRHLAECVRWANARSGVVVVLLAVLAACTDQIDQVEHHVTHDYECYAELWCERSPQGFVLDETVCAADGDVAHETTLDDCDAIGDATCDGSRYWRCAIVCQRTDNPAPCLP